MKTNINKNVATSALIAALIMLPASVVFAKTNGNNSKRKWFGMISYANAAPNPKQAGQEQNQQNQENLNQQGQPTQSSVSPTTQDPVEQGQKTQGQNSAPDQNQSPQYLTVGEINNSGTSGFSPLKINELQNAENPPAPTSSLAEASANGQTLQNGDPPAPRTILITHSAADQQPPAAQAVPAFTNSTLVSALNNISQQFNYTNSSLDPSQTKRMNTIGLGMILSGAGLYVTTNSKNKNKKRSTI